jgi:hypothetical protein
MGHGMRCNFIVGNSRETAPECSTSRTSLLLLLRVTGYPLEAHRHRAAVWSLVRAALERLAPRARQSGSGNRRPFPRPNFDVPPKRGQLSEVQRTFRCGIRQPEVNGTIIRHHAVRGATAKLPDPAAEICPVALVIARECNLRKVCRHAHRPGEFSNRFSFPPR